MSVISTKILLSIFNIILSFLIINTLADGVHKATLEFIIGGSGGGSEGRNYEYCSPPPLIPPSPPALPLPLGQTKFIFADQRLALVFPVIQKFKNIISSDPLGITKSWVGPNICNYKGFYCDNPPDNKSAIALASIDFNGFQLSAPSLDNFLDQLPDIALFHANSNNFSGTISPTIAKLRYLYELDISNNKFSGPFPSAITGMNSLSFLDIRFNHFTGSVPPQLFTQNLDVLFINNNNFMQKLPDNLGNTHALYLTLANNKFIGPIPRSISKALSTLTEVLLLNNMLSGCLPYEIGFLREAIVFDAGNNRLTGPIPFSLGCLEKVEVLNFAGNLLYGMMPEVVCELRNLANLSVSDNYFTYVGPICRRLIRKGVLDVRNNCIPDLPFQRSVAECVAFFAHPSYCPYMATYTYIPSAAISSSTPTGSPLVNLLVPPDASSLLAFKSKADLGDKLRFSPNGSFAFCKWQGVNCLQGKVIRVVIEGLSLGGVFGPNTLTRLDQLRVLSLQNNSLTGPIPDLTGLVNLKTLFLDHNSLLVQSYLQSTFSTVSEP
ncbi:hypothetical protein F0562_027636 [Nyssa sinensis]|uniref:Leucine-rich repeat-containing N-terminal plant-type domain-containing protein n=1 Tax=Nyssa sinensis TaxID=561372 RepID=A0A5J5B5H6_9ASTE|nr:hypothetical protein F0562_027636 [Nyssa sinensis]